MPRAIATYTAADWLRLRPVLQAHKTWLWNRLDRRFVAMQPEDKAAVPRLLERISGQNLIVSIAWNAPWTIRWQLRFINRYLVNARFLVADNSTDPAARKAIAAACADAGADYIALPPNPYRTSRHASRSHGLALNWVYNNVVRPAAPEAWGCFDHDLFPTAPFDPQKRLRGQLFYGDLEERENGSYLWPGYCLFARGVDDDVPLDFRQDWFIGLDTGGMNAGVLAAKRPGRDMVFARRRSIGPQRNFAVTADEIDWFDDCVHLGNASGWMSSNAEREPALDGLLQSIFDGELTPPPEHRTDF